LLYSYYGINIPETGPGSGEYGPINHMFPITPVELHEGWIVGKERIITARGLDVHWEKNGQPVAHLFDLTGREVDWGDRCQITKEDNGWRVKLALKDWMEIAVVE
jgi:hypothetical protein